MNPSNSPATRTRNSLARIPLALDLRHIRRGDLAPVQLVPINLCEPGVSKDVGATRAKVTVPLGKVTDEEVLEQLFGERVKVRGVPDFAGDDLWVSKSGQNSGALFHTASSDCRPR